MVERGGWKPRPKEEKFDAGSQGGNTSGGESSLPNPNHSLEENSEYALKKPRRKKQGGASQKLKEVCGRQKQHHVEADRSYVESLPNCSQEEKDLEDEAFVFPGNVISFRAFSRSLAGRQPHKRLEDKHGGTDHSPDPNNPSKAK